MDGKHPCPSPEESSGRFTSGSLSLRCLAAGSNRTGCSAESSAEGSPNPNPSSRGPAVVWVLADLTHSFFLVKQYYHRIIGSRTWTASRRWG